MNDLIPLPTEDDLIEQKATVLETFQSSLAVGRHIISVLEECDFTILRTRLGKLGSLNPFTDRLPADKSLGLRFGGNIPYSLLTPVGEVRFLETYMEGDWKKAHRTLTHDLGLVTVFPEEKASDKTLGPVYSLTKTPDGILLPAVNPHSVSLRPRHALFDVTRLDEIDPLLGVLLVQPESQVPDNLSQSFPGIPTIGDSPANRFLGFDESDLHL
jgi:hypothetical protein